MQTRYFQDLLDLFNNYPTPAIMQTAAATKQSLTVEELQNAFGGPTYALLGCNYDSRGKAFLNIVGICLGRDSDGNPTTQVECPENTLTNSYDNNCVLDGVSDIYVIPWTLN